MSPRPTADSRRRLPWLAPAFFAGLFDSALAAEGPGTAPSGCDAPGTQVEMNLCAQEEFTAADRKLNEVYQTLLAKEAGNTPFLAKLRSAQKAWLAFRDAELAAMFACRERDPKVCWGSMYPMCYSGYMAKLTRERTQRLQQFLVQGQPADQCH